MKNVSPFGLSNLFIILYELTSPVGPRRDQATRGLRVHTQAWRDLTKAPNDYHHSTTTYLGNVVVKTARTVPQEPHAIPKPLSPFNIFFVLLLGPPGWPMADQSPVIVWHGFRLPHAVEYWVQNCNGKKSMNFLRRANVLYRKL